MCVCVCVCVERERERENAKGPYEASKPKQRDVSH